MAEEKSMRKTELTPQQLAVLEAIELRTQASKREIAAATNLDIEYVQNTLIRLIDRRLIARVFKATKKTECDLFGLYYPQVFLLQYFWTTALEKGEVHANH